jgi:TyrR family helix-turn-helix protein
MRFKISSADRVGISQEILAIIAQQSWNLRAVEIETGAIFIHVAEPNHQFSLIKSRIETVSGVKSCEEIACLPAEQKENHLTALLAKVPDAIVDIDNQGLVLAANFAAKQLLGLTAKPTQPINFAQLINKPIMSLLSNKPLAEQVISLEITLNEQSYLAEITSVYEKNNLSGAVVVIRTMKNLGQQISLLQARNEQQIENIIGHSSAIAELKNKTLRFAELMLPVLITGETGTGKELFARALHEASSRSHAPFLAINCAALPENLLESELFGYAAGAFTGAQRGGKPGLFELAEGGTVFLDEIAEMSTYLQAKLLRFLQDLTFRRIGGSKEITADVRIISATHQNLANLVAQKLFREDLFYRLNVLTLHLPALRDRLEDLSALSQFFITRAALQTNSITPILTEPALAKLKTHQWPGNIRELQNCLFRLVALIDHQKISAHDIELAISVIDYDGQKERYESDNILKTENEKSIIDWRTEQAFFEKNLLQQLYPLYPTTRKLAERLAVSHNKIAMKLKEHGIA